MSELPSKDIDPHVIDHQYYNNPKLELLFTDYQEVINEFPGESLLAFARKYVDATHDPLTQEKEFYSKLNATSDDDAVKLKTIDNPNIDYDKIKPSVNSFAFTQQPSSEVLEDIESYKLKDILDVNVQVILYWVEKFRCAHELVKNEYWSQYPKDDSNGYYNNKNTYFNNFNESMFCIRDSDYPIFTSKLSSADFLVPQK